MTFDIDTIESAEQSVTATVCENAALFGAAPERGEFDSRDVWDADDATDAVSEAFRILAQGVAPDGFQLADERESLLWGFVNCLDAQVRRLDRSRRPAQPGAARPAEGPGRHRDQVARAGAGHRPRPQPRRPPRRLRDRCATPPPTPTAKRPATRGDPRHGSNVSQTGRLTSASHRRPRLHARPEGPRDHGRTCPQGTLVAIAGGKDVADPAAVIRMLDKTRVKHGDMVLVHGGGPGVEKIAARWAERNGIDQVVCKPDWDRHGRAAPFRRNDELLNLLPKGVIAFPGSGITDNLVDKRAAARHPRVPRGIDRASRAASSSPATGGGGAARFHVRSSAARRRRPRGRFAPRSPSALPIADAIACRCGFLSRPPRPSRVPGRTADGTAADLRDGAPDEPAVIVTRHCIEWQCPHRRPLNRRGGSDPPLSPATDSPMKIAARFWRFWTAERLSRHT